MTAIFWLVLGAGAAVLAQLASVAWHNRPSRSRHRALLREQRLADVVAGAGPAQLRSAKHRYDRLRELPSPTVLRRPRSEKMLMDNCPSPGWAMTPSSELPDLPGPKEPHPKEENMTGDDHDDAG